MIDREAVASIIDQYERHGWKLRRVLLSGDLSEKDADITAAVFGNAERREADIDAAWFSRSSRPGVTAWELRHLSTTPYALLETIRDGAAADEIEEALAGTEARLQEALTRRRSN